MAIEVTVTEQCGRCKRKEQVTIPSDQIEAFEQKEQKQVADRERVEAFIKENAGNLPDLVVIFKGKVRMTSQVCDAHCAKTVVNSLDTLFREPKPRKPRTKKTVKEGKSSKKNKDSEDKAATAPTG
jgi:hypothetical protein